MPKIRHKPKAGRPESDTEIVLMARRGDKDAAWDGLYERHGPRIHRLAESITSPADADDITQEAFLSAFRHIDEVDVDRFGAWISRIAVNAARSSVRRGKSGLQMSPASAIKFNDPRARKHFQNQDQIQLEQYPYSISTPYFDFDQEVGSKAKPPEQALMEREALEAFLGEVERLPTRQREIMHHLMKGRSRKETAELMGISPITVKTKYYAAVNKLRGRMKRRFGD
jgi:RNA polymerase sigma-70 factor (ECF subfamily)